jgi:hypothetical protein
LVLAAGGAIPDERRRLPYRLGRRLSQGSHPVSEHRCRIEGIIEREVACTICEIVRLPPGSDRLGHRGSEPCRDPDASSVLILDPPHHLAHLVGIVRRGRGGSIYLSI